MSCTELSLRMHNTTGLTINTSCKIEFIDWSKIWWQLNKYNCWALLNLGMNLIVIIVSADDLLPTSILWTNPNNSIYNWLFNRAIYLNNVEWSDHTVIISCQLMYDIVAWQLTVQKACSYRHSIIDICNTILNWQSVVILYMPATAHALCIRTSQRKMIIHLLC